MILSLIPYELEDLVILSTGKVLLGEAVELTPDEVDEFCEYIISKGGPGSGNFGHAGRPGLRGGSGLGGGKGSGKKPEPKKEEPKKEEHGSIKSPAQIAYEKQQMEFHSEYEKLFPKEKIIKTQAQMKQLHINDYDDYSLDKHNEELANNIHKDFSSMYKKFPKIESIMRNNPLHSLKIGIPGSSRLHLNKNSDGCYLVLTKDIEIAHTKDSMYKGELKLKKGQNSSNKPWVSTTGQSGAVAHELGHHVFESLSENKKQEWKDVHNSNIKISKYAETNHNEGFAETFAAFIHSNYKAVEKTDKNIKHSLLFAYMKKYFE